jgi:ferredoxin
MVKYRVVINRDRCVDCGISVGRCPAHARLLARVLGQNCKQTSGERPSMGVFSEDLYYYVKKLVEACPEKALIIEKIE